MLSGWAIFNFPGPKIIDLWSELSLVPKKELKKMLEPILETYLKIYPNFGAYINDNDESIAIVNEISKQTGYDKVTVLTFLIVLEDYARSGKIDLKWWKPEEKNTNVIKSVSKTFNKIGNVTMVTSVAAGILGLAYITNQINKRGRYAS